MIDTTFKNPKPSVEDLQAIKDEIEQRSKELKELKELKKKYKEFLKEIPEMQSSLKRFNEEYDVKLETCDGVQNSEDFKDFKDLNLRRTKSFHELFRFREKILTINKLMKSLIKSLIKSLTRLKRIQGI